ncbi:hypothetical protein DE146DRAFT_612508 [Phaeosphaeria sp. MPI-PUGE-AT-0046c]|nr:hypothetical protein DE146DRAFT_612508 [Phaeosphaeria sp. MPI-PUGE-AT-0046c]
MTAAAHIAEPRSVIRPTRPIDTSRYPGWDEPHLTKTPWELERHKKQRHAKVSQPTVPARIFKDLPTTIYECIIAQLEQIYLCQEQPCPACYLGDLHTLSLVSRAWNKATVTPMYRRIMLLVNEDHTKLPKLRIRGTSRLKLLRRTLRAQPALARRTVRELHLSDFWTLYQDAAIEREEIVSAIASLIMACPMLERVTGFHLPFTHSYNRLSHALSTRANLKEKFFLSQFEIDSSDEEDDDLGAYYLAACDPTERFLEINSNHAMLSTLVLHSTTLNFRAIVGTLRQLPSLRDLSISRLPSTSFTNMTLNALPSRLRSLRLDDLPGIDDKGLQRFTKSHLMSSLEVLMFLNLELYDLNTVSNVISTRSTNLKSFYLAQDRAPRHCSGGPTPIFSSRTLQYLHWEIRSDDGPLPTSPPLSDDESTFPFTNSAPITCLATSLLAKDISEGNFPSLRRIRAPYDPQGLLQALCKPLATALLPCDVAMLDSLSREVDVRNFLLAGDGLITHLSKPKDSSTIEPSSPRADSAIDSSISTGDWTESLRAPERCRLAAQARILAARKVTFMTVRVFVPDGNLGIEKTIGGFVGRVNSWITYDVRTDRDDIFNAESEPRSEWLMNAEDLCGERGAEYAHSQLRKMRSCGHHTGENLWNQTVLAEDLFQSRTQ